MSVYFGLVCFRVTPMLIFLSLAFLVSVILHLNISCVMIKLKLEELLVMDLTYLVFHEASSRHSLFCLFFTVGSNVENRVSQYGEITKARRNRYDISQECDSKAS